MSDEIDIEEHDLLDNPTIRKIFPDLSIIKREISQYEEGLDAAIKGTTSEAVASEGEVELTVTDHHDDSITCMVEDWNSQKNTQQKIKDSQLEVHLRFKTFLDSLADDVFENSDDNQSHTFNDIIPSSPFNQNQENVKLSSNNIFILGSKPNLIQPETKITEKKQLKIALKNVWPYLKGSKQYCKHCFILFPNTDELNGHINKIHTLRTSDSLKKKNNQNRLKFTEIQFQCEICNVTLCSKGNLVRHLKTVHKVPKPNIKSANFIYKSRSSKTNNKRFKTKKLLRKDIKTKSAENNNCFHCHKQFESQSSLIEHLYDVLNPNKVALKDPNESKHSKKSDIMLDKGGDNINNRESSKLNENKKEIHLNSNSTSISIDNDLQKAYSACIGLIELKVTENKQKSSRLNELTENIKMCITEQRDVVANKNSESKSTDHNLFYHQSADLSDRVISNGSDNQDKVKNSANVISMQNKQVYQCYICSQYKKRWKWYINHMNGHNIKNMLDADTVIFDAQCKFCDVKNPCDLRLYNRHISHFHREKINKKVNTDGKAFNSVLFKCLKCEVCFLTASASKKHSEHVAIFVNWKCPDCHRLFKIKDRAVHLKQHLLSKNITVLALSDSALDRVLYKCLRCAVHFSEKEYFIHYATCDLEMPNSAYCKTCDILVNRNDIALHELRHKDKKLQLNDFTLIESDVINNVKQHNKKEKQNTHTKSKFALTFCSTCNCFLSDHGRKRKAHIEGRCGVINPRMCRKCGLTFTSRGYLSHKMLHDKIKNLTLQAFYFYDIKTKKQIRPSMPKYADCNICEVHFLGKKAFREHLCTKQNSTTCNFCKIKLTEAAFKLHVNFHNYKLSTALSRKQRASYNAENAITSTTNSTFKISKSVVSWKTAMKHKMSGSVLQKMESSGSEVEDAVTSTTSMNATNNLSTQNLISNVSENVNINDSLVLFTCILCHVTVDMYDKVVEHCHDHYDYKERLLTQKNEPSNDNLDENGATKIKYDPFYIRFDKDIWIKHIFEKLTAEQVVYILEHTKYKFECRLKMEEIQSSAPSIVNGSTLYKCDICRSFVEPTELYTHVGTKCTTTKKHPCSVCGLCFATQSYKNIHEKTHDSPNKNKASYKIILFNKRVHQQFTQMMLASRNKFILYQCRNCEVIIDKLQREVHQCSSVELIKCSHCGLLFYDKELKLHTIKHELIKQFQSEHMIVIMFGKLGCKRDNKVKPCFNGTIYDFTFYKCTQCGLCFKTKSRVYKHVCVSKSYESQCPKCYLCFLKKDLEEHFQLHEHNLELVYDDFNSNIISFTKNTAVRDTVQNAISKKQEEIDKESNVNNLLNDNMSQKIYKCRCGLHFLDEFNAKKHLQNCNPRMKISRQSCFKCDLLFTPGELFNHLLKHHSNKKLQYKYDIISVLEASENKNSDV